MRALYSGSRVGSEPIENDPDQSMAPPSTMVGGGSVTAV